jgi:hypothetical protein
VSSTSVPSSSTAAVPVTALLLGLAYGMPSWSASVRLATHAPHRAEVVDVVAVLHLRPARDRVDRREAVVVFHAGASA